MERRTMTIGQWENRDTPFGIPSSWIEALIEDGDEVIVIDGDRERSVSLENGVLTLSE